MRHNRRLLLGLVSMAGVVAFVFPSFAQAATSTFSGTLLVHEPKKASEPFPCSGEELCASGTLRGLGLVELRLNEEEFDPIEGTGCFTGFRLETITALDGSGTIGLESMGTACTPGGSLERSHEHRSFGNPVFFDMAFNVNGEHSTGLYAGAKGSGIESAQFAGATGVWRLNGTITTE
jgi:hypothetical protein